MWADVPYTRFMKILTYAGSDFVTGDDVAGALLRYSAALADDHSAATISIPVVSSDGEVSMASFLVGPASQIVSSDAEGQREELASPEVVAHLEELTRALHPVATTSRDEPDDDAWIEEI